MRFLPPMSVWYSGTLPYRILLPAQVVLLVLMTAMALDVTRAAGTVAEARPDLSRALESLSFVYFGAILFRSGVRIRSAAGRRWYEGGTVPTLFHYVLIGFLNTYARAIAG